MTSWRECYVCGYKGFNQDKCFCDVIKAERERIKGLLVKFIDGCNTIQEVEDVEGFWKFEAVDTPSKEDA